MPFTRLFVIACSKSKSPDLLDSPMPAREAYRGIVFRKAVAVLERENLTWCILSAKYGFIWPETIIEFYDQRIRPARVNTTTLEQATRLLEESQLQMLRASDEIVVIGGKDYAENVARLLCRKVKVPFKGMAYVQMRDALSNWKPDDREQPSTVNAIKVPRRFDMRKY